MLGRGVERSNPSIAAFRNGFDVTRRKGVIAQGNADFLYRGIERVVELDKGVFGPNLFAQLLARDEFSGALEKSREHLKGLFLQTNACPTLTQFSCVKVGLEKTEADDAT